MSKAEQLLADVLEEYKDELTKEACDNCDDCGALAMCRFHSLLSALCGSTWTNPAIERERLRNTTPMNATIYTDGSCYPNPGPGGYAAIIVTELGERIVTGKVAGSTNNRMELTAVVEALESLPVGSSVTVHSDSAYVVNGSTRWVDNWQKRNWLTREGKPVVNQDLWERILLAKQIHTVTFKWLRGHNGHVYNERCDALCRKARES